MTLQNAQEIVKMEYSDVAHIVESIDLGEEYAFYLAQGSSKAKNYVGTIAIVVNKETGELEERLIPEVLRKLRTMDDGYLAHHGVLGQRWGIRRYQNEDGTLTPAGKRHVTKTYSKNYAKMTKQMDKGHNTRSSHALNKAYDAINNDLLQKYNKEYDKKYGNSYEAHMHPRYEKGINAMVSKEYINNYKASFMKDLHESSAYVKMRDLETKYSLEPMTDAEIYEKYFA